MSSRIQARGRSRTRADRRRKTSAGLAFQTPLGALAQTFGLLRAEGQAHERLELPNLAREIEQARLRVGESHAVLLELGQQGEAPNATQRRRRSRSRLWFTKPRAAKITRGSAPMARSGAKARLSVAYPVPASSTHEAGCFVRSTQTGSSTEPSVSLPASSSTDRRGSTRTDRLCSWTRFSSKRRRPKHLGRDGIRGTDGSDLRAEVRSA